MKELLFKNEKKGNFPFEVYLEKRVFDEPQQITVNEITTTIPPGYGVYISVKLNDGFKLYLQHGQFIDKEKEQFESEIIKDGINVVLKELGRRVIDSIYELNEVRK